MAKRKYDQTQLGRDALPRAAAKALKEHFALVWVPPRPDKSCALYYGQCCTVDGVGVGLSRSGRLIALADKQCRVCVNGAWHRIVRGAQLLGVHAPNVTVSASRCPPLIAKHAADSLLALPIANVYCRHGGRPTDPCIAVSHSNRWLCTACLAEFDALDDAAAHFGGPSVLPPANYVPVVPPTKLCVMRHTTPKHQINHAVDADALRAKLNRHIRQGRRA